MGTGPFGTLHVITASCVHEALGIQAFKDDMESMAIVHRHKILYVEKNKVVQSTEPGLSATKTLKDCCMQVQPNQLPIPHVQSLWLSSDPFHPERPGTEAPVPPHTHD